LRNLYRIYIPANGKGVPESADKGRFEFLSTKRPQTMRTIKARDNAVAELRFRLALMRHRFVSCTAYHKLLGTGSNVRNHHP